jgi:hypothetical protein
MMSSDVTRYTISHHGVPIASAELTLGDAVTVGIVTPFAAYEAIRPLVQEASAALRVIGFPEPDDSGGRVEDPTVLARAAALGRALELRDDHGAVVATDFIELMEQSAPDAPSPIVWVRSRHAATPRPAVPLRPDAAGGNSSARDA